MIKLIFILLSALFLTHCTSNDQTVSHTIKENNSKADITKSIVAIPDKDTTFKLDFFKTIPDTIGGCGEYLTYDTSTFAKDKYIFLSNLSEYALIKINGETIYLKKDKVNSQAVNNENYVAVYQGQGYRVVLTMKQIKTYDEGGYYSGTLHVASDKLKATFKVHGEAGC